MICDLLFRKVVIVTPDRRAHGGIASVTAAYSRHFAGLAYVETNSRYGSVAGALKLLWALLKLPWLRVTGRSILHIHSAAGKSFRRKRIVMAWGRLLGFKIIFHSHSGLFVDTVAAAGVDKIRRILAPCRRIAVLSTTWKRYFEDTLHLADVRIVNNIVDPCGSEIHAAAAEKEDGRHTPLCFLFMGLLMQRKGIFDILEAIRPLAAEYPGRFTLVVGGAHGEEARFHRIISEPPLSSCVIYAGWLDERAKAERLAAADAVILPSYAEGVPLTILEGFARGIPAIATAVGGIPDMMTDDVEGILVKPGDVDALRTAIRSYIDDPALLWRHGEAARRRAAAYYPDAVAAQLHALYDI